MFASQSLLDSYITEQIKNNLIPGAVILIAQEGRVLHEKAYGYAEKFRLVEGKLISSDIPMTTQHLFDLASITKPLATGFGIMLLIDQGKLDLDKPIKTYLPAFNQSDKSKITTRHLLLHTAGFTAWKPIYYHACNKETALQFIIDLPLAYPTGEKRLYSDLDFMVLSYLIESITGQAFEAFLHEHLYQQLNLQNTLFNPLGKKEKVASTSHGNPFEYRMVADPNFCYPCDEKLDDFNAWRTHTLHGEVNDGNAHHVFAGTSGHAGLFSTANEVNILMQLMLNQGSHQSTQLIKSNTIQSFITKHPNTQHGLAWSMSDGKGPGNLPLGELSNHPLSKDIFGHTGFTGTLVLGIPQKHISIVLLTNLQNLGVDKKTGHYNDIKHFRENVIRLAVDGVALMGAQRTSRFSHCW